MRTVWDRLGRSVVAVALAGFNGLAPWGSTAAQEKLSSRPIEVIVPWGPGGGADVIARILGKWFESDLAANVPVVNLPGALGTIGLGKLLGRPGDGHTLGVLTTDTLLFAAVADSPIKPSDLFALAVVVRQPNGIYARTDGRFRSWADVATEARARPGGISIAVTGANSPDEVFVKHLAARGVALNAIGYSKPAERYASVLGGHVDLLIEQAGDIRGHLESKALRPLLFFAPARLDPPFAEVPVGPEFGYEVFLQQFRAIVIRAGSDPARAEALGASLERFSRSPEYARYLREQYALPDSFVGFNGAQAYVTGELRSIVSVHQAVGSAK